MPGSKTAASSPNTGTLVVTNDITRMALDGAALRLAWYVRTYGGIPAPETIRLTLVAKGLHKETDAGEPLSEARAINDYLLSICRSPRG